MECHSTNANFDNSDDNITQCHPRPELMIQENDDDDDDDDDHNDDDDDTFISNGLDYPSR